MHVDARGEPLVHERSRELIGALVVGHRRQHDRKVAHGSLVRADEIVVLFSFVARDFRGTACRAATAGPRGRSRRIVHIVLLFVASVIVADGLVGDRGLLAMLRARQEYETVAASIAALHAENARLREQARRLREDPAAIEEVARRELGLIKPGETVFIIKDVPPSKP